MQTNVADSEIGRCSVLTKRIITLFNYTIVKTQKTPLLSIVSKFSDLH